MKNYIYDLDGYSRYYSEKPLKAVRKFVNQKLEYIIVSIDYDNQVKFESATLDNDIIRIKVEFGKQINQLFELYS